MRPYCSDPGALAARPPHAVPRGTSRVSVSPRSSSRHCRHTASSRATGPGSGGSGSRTDSLHSGITTGPVRPSRLCSRNGRQCVVCSVSVASSATITLVLHSAGTSSAAARSSASHITTSRVAASAEGSSPSSATASPASAPGQNQRHRSMPT